MAASWRQAPLLTTVLLMCPLLAGSAREGCILPEHPPHGVHTSVDTFCPPGPGGQSPACRSVPGTMVPDGWLLLISCDPLFIPDTEEHRYSPSTCADGKWISPLPSCVYNFTKDKYKCTAPPYPKNGKYHAMPIECAIGTAVNVSVPGTYLPALCILQYSCNDGFLLDDEDVISICDKGKWIPNNVICKKATQLITKNVSPNFVSPGGCILPVESNNRKFCSFNCLSCSQCAYTPGTFVTDFVIKVQCDPGYRSRDNHDTYSTIVCVNGSWSAAFPQCLKTCPALETESATADCYYGPLQVNCADPVLPTTTAKPKCRPSYQEDVRLAQAGLYRNILQCKYNGQWSLILPECRPVCGVSNGNITITPTVVHGKATELGAFPWHAGLYERVGVNDWDCVCGGSLITNRIVLTAAHCVDSRRPSDLRVALGKKYRSWQQDEKYAIKRSVTRINYPKEYTGGVNSFSFDIALLLLNESVQFNSFIMPVCRDVNLGFDSSKNITGYVVGWGKVFKDGSESQVLLHNDLTVVNYKDCQTMLTRILSFGKICGVKGSESIAERGDSGGGLTTVFNDLHYIHGIVSTKHNTVSVFTNISWDIHKSWLDSEIKNLNLYTD